MNYIRMTADEVGERICIPTSEWPGNCYAIANTLLEAGLVKGKLRYGHYLGYVEPGTMFHGRPLIGHGWIEVKDPGLAEEGMPSDIVIVDPTRWVFEAKDPYIFQAPDFKGEYDVAGNAFRSFYMLARPVPRFDPEDRPVDLPEGSLGAVMRQLLNDHIGSQVSACQVHYLANLPPNFMDGFAKDIFRWLEGAGLKAFVPIDNWNLIMEEE